MSTTLDDGRTLREVRTDGRTLREIHPDALEGWLEEHGYNGLYTYETDDPCGCRIGGIAPCGGDPLDCCPGVYSPSDELLREISQHGVEVKQ